MNNSAGWRTSFKALARIGAIFSLAATIGVLGLSSGRNVQAATQYTVQVGGGAGGISVEEFRPDTIFVHAGDSIKFSNPYEEIHTVTYAPDGKIPDFIVPAGPPTAGGPPKIIVNTKVSNPAQSLDGRFDGTAYTNSGVIGKGQSFVVNFTAQGNFNFVCVIHPGMEVGVSVVDAAVKTSTQSEIDAAAAIDLSQDVANGEVAAKGAKPTKTANANGSTTWQVVNVPSAAQADVMRFIPPRLEVAAGDTVTWSNTTLVPHTVTFTSGGATPELITPQFAAAGPPTLVLNPAVLFPSMTPKTYDGTGGLVNSGFLGAGPEATAGTSFSLTFTKPGTYLYLCVLHADQGMTGVVQVGAATGTGGATITPPSTGDAGLARQGQSLQYAGFAALVAAMFVAGVVAFRRLGPSA